MAKGNEAGNRIGRVTLILDAPRAIIHAGRSEDVPAGIARVLTSPVHKKA